MSRVEPSDSFYSKYVPSLPYCAPALVYLLLSIIMIISMFWNISSGTLVVKIIFVFAWTWFLNYLCESGFSMIAWFLVLLPFLMFLLMLFFAFEIMTMMTVTSGTQDYIPPPLPERE
jgi:hypothetical protein